MPQTCHTRDFSFQVADDWVDRSMIAWSAPIDGRGPTAPNLMIAYDRPPPEETVGAYVNRQLQDLSTRAQGFQLELRRDAMLAGQAAVEIMFQWNSGSGIIRQRQIYSLLPDGRCICIVNTAPADRFADSDKQFLAILDSFVWSGPKRPT
ncbi:DcrB-related protein [Niveispirillum irakense]|uniref:DcrB-related protein n=1 Tax=Niveispirillum irakense TaxID=34011 RepID=UPI00040D5356|nr:DcrB-related protein [Niveispirillum irakense]